MTPLTSAELNYMVFRYLQESGFTHSAFNLGYEAGIMNKSSSIDPNMVPPGALVTVVQKGLQYIEMEANLNNNDTDVDEDFSFINPFELLTKDVYELKQIVEERKKEQHKAAEELAKQQETQTRVAIERDKQRTNVKRGGPAPMDISTSSRPASGFSSSDVMILEGHASEVCACSWNPAGSFLASGSGDATARIWNIPDRTSRSGVRYEPRVLKHAKGRTNENHSKDVTTLDWNSDGTRLATGAYDGIARIWNTDGELTNTLAKHKGAIFTLKWNKKGDYLLTGSFDETVIVWDVNSEEYKQQFKFHTGGILDVDWRTNQSFASASADTMIYVCKIGENRPLKMFSGHTGEVNCVKWDPTRLLLASCSDDATAKIWNLKQEKHVHEFKEHNKEIYTIRWSPTGPGTNNPNRDLLLASASFDSTVKLWDVEQGRLLRSLNGHRDAVYSINFSPNGEYLASGSLDRCVHVWSIKEGKIIKTYPANGSIFEVCWNKEGDRIAACTNNNTVCVLDFRM